jgi:hypothetical protein
MNLLERSDILNKIQVLINKYPIEPKLHTNLWWRWRATQSYIQALKKKIKTA